MPILFHRQNSQRAEFPTRNHAGLWRSPSYTKDRLDVVRRRWGKFVGASYAVRTSARESLHLKGQPERPCLVAMQGMACAWRKEKKQQL